MGFDLKTIKTEQSFDYEIRDLDGNPTGVVFTLASPTHPDRRALDLAQSRKIIRQSNKTGRVMLPDPEDGERERPKSLAACTLGWTGYEAEGQPVPFSKAAAQALYEDAEMRWLADQVDEALGNKALFTKASSPS